MAYMDTEPEESFPRGYRNKPTRQRRPPPEKDVKDEFSSSISWPIILAIIPTLGAFIAGSAEVWSDFIMILLILYYIYKWITVPWSYYESARSRRIIHSSTLNHQAGLDKRSTEREEMIKSELHRHEMIGLFLVITSPAFAGYSLQYSRYILSNHDKYMSSFNVVVFVLAASLKPLIHCMTLLRERTLFLQNEVMVDDSEIELLQRKMDLLEEEVDGLRKAFATKRDLGQVANGLTPTIQQLSKAFKRVEKKEQSLRTWSEERFQAIDHKVQDFDQFIFYTIEQDQRTSAQRLLVTLMFLPINLTFWAAKRMTNLLPIPRALLGMSHTTRQRHLTHRDDPSELKISDVPPQLRS